MIILCKKNVLGDTKNKSIQKHMIFTLRNSYHEQKKLCYEEEHDIP